MPRLKRRSAYHGVVEELFLRENSDQTLFSSACALRQSRIFRGHAADDGPILILISSRHRGDEAVAHHTCNGHRHVGSFRRLKDEAHIFQSERQQKSCRFMLALHD